MRVSTFNILQKFNKNIARIARSEDTIFFSVSDELSRSSIYPLPLFLAMAKEKLKEEQDEEEIMLQVKVPISLRDRLKLQSVIHKMSMGELTDKLLSEALDKLESQPRTKR